MSVITQEAVVQKSWRDRPGAQGRPRSCRHRQEQTRSLRSIPTALASPAAAELPTRSPRPAPHRGSPRCRPL